MHGQTINSSLQNKEKESKATYTIPGQSSGASCSKNGTNHYPLDKCCLNN